MYRHQRSIDGIACEISGEGHGQDILLLHGWGCDHRSFELQIASLAGSSRVIAADLPGFGNSVPVAEPTIGRFAQRMLHLLSELGSGGVSIVGHSMGGLVALEMSHEAPELVERLAMLETVLWPDQNLSNAISGINHILQAGQFAEALAAAKEALFLPSDGREAVQSFEQSFEAADRDSLVATFAAHLIDYDAEPAIAALKCPVAYIATDSALASLEQLTSRIRGVRTAKVLGSGHFAPLLVPQQVNAMLAAFLSMPSMTRGNEKTLDHHGRDHDG